MLRMMRSLSVPAAVASWKKSLNYWRIERLYRIPEDVIHFGEENLIAIRVEDLYGGEGIIGAPVEIIVGGGKTKWSFPYLGKKIWVYNANMQTSY